MDFGYVRNLLLHGTKWGRWIVDTFWWKLGSDLIDQTHIAKHPETKKLMLDQPRLWYGVSLSILNHLTNIYEFVRGRQVKVLRKDVKCLESLKTIHFEDGSLVESDALVCSISWKFEPTIDFRPKETHADLGIPSADFSHTQEDLWDRLDARKCNYLGYLPPSFSVHCFRTPSFDSISTLRECLHFCFMLRSPVF